MSIVIRDVREHELDSVLALNNAAGPAILPLDAARLRRFHSEAEYFRIAERDGALAGFLVGFGSEALHDSENFHWFRERHPHFFYIDRIAVASRRRGGGVGRAFYADVQSYAELRYPQMACEVFLEPGSDPALLFHGSFGFREIGQRVMPDGTGAGAIDVAPAPGRRAAMLMKELCSYPWVRDTYGAQLPPAPWITLPRAIAIAAPQRATGT
jgi:predicted GNAT superfamily acetyltransferase